MRERAGLTLFAHVVGRPEAELDLAEAALLIAEAEYPGLDIARYTSALDDLGERARSAVRAYGGEAIDAVVKLLFEAEGFRGNDEDYYDPRNSFLNDVLDRRSGIPITLAVVLTEVCRRVDVTARGVSFPGHFLVRAEHRRGSVLIDPFTGRQLSRDQLRTLHARATGQPKDPPERLLAPASKIQILARMLNNLRGIYEQRGDEPRLRGVLELLHVLAPGDELRARIEALGGEVAAAVRARPAGVN